VTQSRWVDGPAVELQRAAVDGLHAGEDAQQRRLPCPVRSDDSRELTADNVEVADVENPTPTAVNAQVAQTEQRDAHAAAVIRSHS
jgi:hypothetical protein